MMIPKFCEDDRHERIKKDSAARAELARFMGTQLHHGRPVFRFFECLKCRSDLAVPLEQETEVRRVA